MGEMADFFLDQQFDGYDCANEWNDEDIDHDFRTGPDPKSCNKCGESDLFWRHTDDGWRLVDTNGLLHQCKNQVCKRCQQAGLHWVETQRGWRLFEGEDMHVCAGTRRGRSFRR